MKKGFLLICSAIMLQSLGLNAWAQGSAHAPKADNEGERPTFGLVLSGGGARGIAEIGAIQALEENDIPIDYITGTSMGAIVGGLYAAGYSPREMMELITSPTFLNASTGTIEGQDKYMFFEPPRRPSMVTLNFGTDSLHPSKLLPASLISPMPMNFQFMAIFAPYTAQCGGDFDKLFVPLRTVASDMTEVKKVVFRDGQLDDAVRASMSFPIVFKPVTLNGHLLYDGGIFDNFPVELMKEDFNPSFILGIDIHSSAKPKGFPDIMQQIDNLVIRPTTDYSVPEEEGMYLRIDLNEFSLLDFPKAEEIYEIGYRHTLEVIDSIKSRTPARRSAREVANRRAKFHAATPRPIFESVNVEGGSEKQNEYISRLFTNEHPDTFGLNAALDSYTKAISTEKLRDLEPQASFDRQTRRFNLNLLADVKQPFDVSLGGYITSSTNSMLFLSGAYRPLSYGGINASLSGWIGQSYMAGELDLRALLRHRQTSSVGLQAVIWKLKYRESDELFYEDDSPAFTNNLEAFVRANYALATGRNSMFEAGVGYGHINDKFYNNDIYITMPGTQRSSSRHNLGQVMAKWTRSTLDDPLLPTAGSSFGAMLQGVMGRYNYTPGATEDDPNPVTEKDNVKWLQAEISYQKFFKLSNKFSLGISTNDLYSTRSLIDNYNAAIVNASSFNPTAASYNMFNPRMRANAYVTFGVEPVMKFGERFQLRGSMHCFMPMRRIDQDKQGMAVYGRWFSNPEFFGELSAVVKLPFANLTLYSCYQTSPGDKWGVGISFGYFVIAPRMLRL